MSETIEGLDMKKTLLVAGALALGLAGPALAKPGNGHGNGNGHGHDNGHGHGHRSAYGYSGPVGYGAGGCPPGLAKKHNGCLPPGQAKKLYGIGQRWPSQYGYRWSYNQIPYDLRRQYGFSPYDRYYYGDGYLCQVDPKTLLIQRVVNAILR